MIKTSHLSDKARTKLRQLRLACEELDRSPRGSHEALRKRLAVGCGMSAERLRKWYAAWRLEGETGLIDKRLLGHCKGPALSQLTVDEWARRAELNTAVQSTGTRSFLWAWRSILRDLTEGKELPGLGRNGEPGTWKDLWMRGAGSRAQGAGRRAQGASSSSSSSSSSNSNSNSSSRGRLKASLQLSLQLPAGCPWSVLCWPKGWSYQSFMDRKPAALETATMQRGMQALHNGAPQVHLDYSKLRPLEFVLIDDKRLDLVTWVRVGNKIQLVEVQSLWAMDLATRRILWVQLFPAYLREDGTKVGINQREVSHFLAAMLAAHGVPTEWLMTIVHENAAAKPADGFDDTVFRASGGRVVLRNTGLWDGKVMVSGFTQKGGSPRGKAPLESYFGHRLDVALGGLQGQMGGRYQLKPGDLDARLQEASRLGKLADVASDAELARLMPVESLGQVAAHLLKAMLELEERTDHELQGFDKMNLWRYSEADPVWKGMEDAEMLALLSLIGVAGVNAVLAKPGCSKQCMESPLMRWGRLYAKENYMRLDEAAFRDMHHDAYVVNYAGQDRIYVDTKKGKQEYRGNTHSLEAGSRCRVVLDLDNLELGCTLLDMAGRMMGRMAWVERAAVTDVETIKLRMEEQAKTKAGLLKAVRTRHQGGEAGRLLLAELDDKSTVLSTIAERVCGKAVPGAMERASSTDILTSMNGSVLAPDAPHKRRGRDVARAKSEALEKEATRLTHLARTTETADLSLLLT